MRKFIVRGSITGNTYGEFPTVAAAMWQVEDLRAAFGASCQHFDIVRIN